jgi:hypothetical protein
MTDVQEKQLTETVQDQVEVPDEGKVYKIYFTKGFGIPTQKFVT